MVKPELSDDGRTVTVRVPISIRRRGGRKLVLAPDGRSVISASVVRHIDSAMVKAVARAFRWRDMLESGGCATIREIANSEKINETYVGRVLRLTLLAPDVIETICDGGQPPGLQLDMLMRRFPVSWEEQSRLFGMQLATGPHPEHPASQASIVQSILQEGEPMTGSETIQNQHVARIERRAKSSSDQSSEAAIQSDGSQRRPYGAAPHEAAP